MVTKRVFEEVVLAKSISFTKIGEVVEGEILQRRIVTIKGKERKLIILDTPDGENTLWLSAALSGLAELNIGAYIRLTYIADKDTGQVEPCRQFKIEVDPTSITKEPF